LIFINATNIKDSVKKTKLDAIVDINMDELLEKLLDELE